MIDTKLTPGQLQQLPIDLIIIGDWESRMIGFHRKGESKGKILSPARSLAVHDHSPDGFNWGYGGSGASQLALAIMLEFFPHEIACAWYMQFKWDFVAIWEQADLEVQIDLCAFAVKYKL